jgi:hypothetical protein
MAIRHASMLLVSPPEPYRSTGSPCALLVLLCVDGRGPALTRGVPSSRAWVGSGSLHGAEPHDEAVGRNNCASQVWTLRLCPECGADVYETGIPRALPEPDRP